MAKDKGVVSTMKDIMKRNNVTILGKGKKAIVFAHGFGCEQGMWRYITPAFEKDYRLILFDYVGSGESDMTAYDAIKYSQLEGYAQDVIDVIETMELEKVIFVGHSVSSMIGLTASIQKPELFEKLVMIGPSPCYINSQDGYEGGFEESDIHELLDMMEMNFAGWASYMAPMAMEQTKDTQQVRDLENTFVSNDPRIARQFAEVTFFSDCRNLLPFVEIDTLILQCSQDSIVPLEVGNYLQKNLKNGELCVLEAKGHYPHISHPEKTIAAIKAYLE